MAISSSVPPFQSTEMIPTNLEPLDYSFPKNTTIAFLQEEFAICTDALTNSTKWQETTLQKIIDLEKVLHTSSRALDTLLDSNPDIKQEENTIEFLTKEYRRTLTIIESEEREIPHMHDLITIATKKGSSYSKERLEKELSAQENYLSGKKKERDYLNQILTMQKIHLQQVKEATGIDLLEANITSLNAMLQPKRATEKELSQRIVSLSNKCVFLKDKLAEYGKWYQKVVLGGVCGSIVMAVLGGLGFFLFWKRQKRSSDSEPIAFRPLDEVDDREPGFSNPVYEQTTYSNT